MQEMRYEEAFSSINNGEEKGFSGFGLGWFLGFSLSSVYVMLLFALLGDRGKQKQTKRYPIRSLLQELKAFTVDLHTYNGMYDFKFEIKFDV